MKPVSRAARAVACVLCSSMLSGLGCGSPVEVLPDASAPDTGTALPEGGPAVDAGVDSGADLDGGGRLDAAGVRDAGVDAGLVDSGGDAAPDSAVVLDASGLDAAADAGEIGDAGGSADAGPARPVGAAVDVTGSRCALDAAGSFWCWGRWTAVEDVRRLGTGFTSAAGSCALRGREVWCAEFTTLTMIPVIEGSSVLEVGEIAEYSDLARGCGLRTAPGGWSEAVCWTDGGSVVREGGGSELVAVTVVEPRMVAAIAGPYDAYDINPPAYPSPTGGCRSNGVYVDCPFITAGSSPARPAGDHFVLGFAMACAHNAGSSTCSTSFRSPSWTVSNPGFRDHAVAWPIGTVDPARPYEARGLCVGGDFGVRCYDDAGAISYTVNW